MEDLTHLKTVKIGHKNWLDMRGVVHIDVAFTSSLLELEPKRYPIYKADFFSFVYYCNYQVRIVTSRNNYGTRFTHLFFQLNLDLFAPSYV